MKIIFLTIYFVLINTSYIFSQKKTPSLQIIGGAGATFLSGNRFEEYSYMYYDYTGILVSYNRNYSSGRAFSFGMLWEPFSRSKRFHMRTGILYERKGYTIKEEFMSNNQITHLEYNSRIHYLAVPVFVR